MTACVHCGYNFERLNEDGRCNSCQAAEANGVPVTVKP